MNLNLEVPINAVSFGNLSFGITHELFKRGISPNIFPIGQPDIGVYNKAPDEYKQFIQNCINKSFKYYRKQDPSLKLWHINGSWSKIGDRQNLLTFHELDSLTEVEANILNQQEKIFVTSSESKQVFEDHGVTRPISLVKLGFDAVHFKKLDKKYYDSDTIVFSIIGKYEKRKWTAKTIQAWCKKFGGQRQYRLHLHVHNVFYNQEQMQAAYAKCFNGVNPPFNVNIYPFLSNLTELNDAFNCTSIVLDMSGGESISLGPLTCVALGKHAVVHYCSAMKDWATEENAVLVMPKSKEPAYDDVFFHPGSPFNNGNIYAWNEDEFIAGCERAIERYKSNPVNTAGLKLQQDYSFQNGVDTILKEMV